MPDIIQVIEGLFSIRHKFFHQHILSLWLIIEFNKVVLLITQMKPNTLTIIWEILNRAISEGQFFEQATKKASV